MKLLVLIKKLIFRFIFNYLKILKIIKYKSKRYSNILKRLYSKNVLLKYKLSFLLRSLRLILIILILLILMQRLRLLDLIFLYFY